MPNGVRSVRSIRINVSNSNNNNQPPRPQVRRRATPPAQPRPVSRNRNLQVPIVPNILSNLSPFRRTKSTRPTRKKIKGYKDTQSQGKKRKTKVNVAKKSKRASQKKRGRKMSKRQRGGGTEAQTNTTCGQLLFAIGLKGKLNNVPQAPGGHKLNELFNSLIESPSPKKKIEDASFIDEFVNELIDIITQTYSGAPSTVFSGKYGPINLTLEKTDMIKPNENLVDYLKRKLEQAVEHNLTFTAFINTLTNKTLGFVLCNKIQQGHPEYYKGEKNRKK